LSLMGSIFPFEFGGERRRRLLVYCACLIKFWRSANSYTEARKPDQRGLGQFHTHQQLMKNECFCLDSVCLLTPGPFVYQDF
jgi:hypothetical protein